MNEEAIRYLIADAVRVALDSLTLEVVEVCPDSMGPSSYHLVLRSDDRSLHCIPFAADVFDDDGGPTVVRVQATRQVRDVRAI